MKISNKDKFSRNIDQKSKEIAQIKKYTLLTILPTFHEMRCGET